MSAPAREEGGSAGVAKPPPTGLLLVITGLPQLGAALTLPSLPSLRAEFGVPVDVVQLTISAYFLFLGFTQLPYGVLSDRFGRRPLLVISLGLYALAGIACAFATSLTVLIVLRALQGLGASGCVVLSRAVVNDAWQGQEAVRMMSFAMLAPATVSLLAPLTGGWLLAGLGWHGVFATIGLAGLVAWTWSLRGLPETIGRRDPTATDPSRMLGNIGRFLASPQCLVLTIVSALIGAGVYVYSATSAFVLIEVFGVPSAHYGWFLVMTGIAMVSGNWVGGRIPPERRGRILFAMTFVALAAAWGVLAASVSGLRGAWGIAAIMAPMIVYGFCAGLFSPAMAVATLRFAPGIAGVASAIMGTFFMGSGALFVWIGGKLYDGTPSALGIGVALACTLWAALYLGFARRWI